MSFEMSREQYASLYGPTTGDAIRLADTELFARIEKDLTTPARRPCSAAARWSGTAWARTGGSGGTRTFRTW